VLLLQGRREWCGFVDSRRRLLYGILVPTLIIMKIAFLSSLLTYSCHVTPKRCYLSASAAIQKRVIFIATATQDFDDEMFSRILKKQDFRRVIRAANEYT
jgi:hypothetical protein